MGTTCRLQNISCLFPIVPKRVKLLATCHYHQSFLCYRRKLNVMSSHLLPAVLQVPLTGIKTSIDWLSLEIRICICMNCCMTVESLYCIILQENRSCSLTLLVCSDFFSSFIKKTLDAMFGDYNVQDCIADCIIILNFTISWKDFSNRPAHATIIEFMLLISCLIVFMKP